MGRAVWAAGLCVCSHSALTDRQTATEPYRRLPRLNVSVLGTEKEPVWGPGLVWRGQFRVGRKWWGGDSALHGAQLGG